MNQHKEEPIRLIKPQPSSSIPISSTTTRHSKRRKKSVSSEDSMSTTTSTRTMKTRIPSRRKAASTSQTSKRTALSLGGGTAAATSTSTRSSERIRKVNSRNKEDTNIKRFAAELNKVDPDIGPPNEETVMNLIRNNKNDVQEAVKVYIASVKALQYTGVKAQQHNSGLSNPQGNFLLEKAMEMDPNLDMDSTVIGFRCICTDGQYEEKNPMQQGIKPKSPSSTASIRTHVSGKNLTQFTSYSGLVGTGAVEFSYLSERKGGKDPDDILIVVVALDLKEKNNNGELVNIDLSGSNSASEIHREEAQLHTLYTRGHYSYITKEILHRGSLSAKHVLCVVPWSKIKKAWMVDGELRCLGLGCTNMPVDRYVCRGCDKFGVIDRARYSQCLVNGCIRYSIRGSDFCTKHGGVALKCSEDGCTNQAQWCIENKCIEKCRKHGAKRKLCKTEGCKNKAIKGGVCSKHGGYSQCLVNGCIRYSIRGSDFCTKHGGVALKCSVVGCTSQARWCNEKNCIENCRRHGSKPKLCTTKGCTNQALLKGVCCRHGAKQKLCTTKGCTNHAKRKGLCFRHSPKPKLCTTKGCMNHAQMKGVCFRHSAKPKHAKTKRKRKLCTTKGCKKNAQMKGLCSSHGAFKHLSQEKRDEKRKRSAEIAAKRRARIKRLKTV